MKFAIWFPSPMFAITICKLNGNFWQIWKVLSCCIFIVNSLFDFATWTNCTYYKLVPCS